MKSLALVVAPTLALGACQTPTPEDRPRTFGGDRPVDLAVPDTIEDGRSYPLVLVLHGYSVNGFIQQAYLGMSKLVDQGEALVLAPTGLDDRDGKPFWNADEVCCDFDGLAPDDSGYLGTLIDEVADSWPVDRDAVFAIGHANGGHMAYRLGCDRADLLAGIVVIAGGTGFETCAPTEPVSALHLHGTADPEFAFEGGGPFQMSPGAPGAVESITRWAGYDGCTTTRTAGAAIDLDARVAGAETTPEAFACDGPGVELWTMQDTTHLPDLTDRFIPAVWPWLLDHRR